MRWLARELDCCLMGNRWHSGTAAEKELLSAWAIRRSPGWLEHVNSPQTDAELTAIRRSVNRGTPFGTEAWAATATKSLGLEIPIPLFMFCCRSAPLGFTPVDRRFESHKRCQERMALSQRIQRFGDLKIRRSRSVEERDPSRS